MLKKEHIEGQFRCNSIWKNIFLSKYPNWSVDTWTEDVWKLFKDNGYTYEIERYSNNPESSVYCAVKSCDLFYKGEFIIGYGDSHITSCLEQLLIGVICNFEIDFNTLK